MRSIGSSIIILAACMLFVAAGYSRDPGVHTGLTALGAVVGLIGLVGWLRAPKQDGRRASGD